MLPADNRVTVPSRADVLAAARASLPEGQSAWLVGGTIRDELLGVDSKDLDVAVTGGAESFARGLADRLDASVYPSSDTFGTWRVLAGAIHVDVAPLRAAPGAGSASEEPLQADLRARDFTVNAMARPLAGGPLVDPLGGASDLAARRLRMCSASAFVEDPLRVVRLARLAHDLRMAPESGTVTAARSAGERLTRVSGERIRDEMSLLLSLRSAAQAMRDLAEWEVLSHFLPEVDRLRGVEQNSYHHHDVFGHSVEALSYVQDVVSQLGGIEHLHSPEEVGLPGAPPIAPVAWAALLHDIGKPDCRAVGPDGRITFWYHDELGSQMIPDLAERLRFSGRFTLFLQTLVRHHLRLGFLVREQPITKRALARYRRDVTPWVFESVVVSLCDRLATRGEKTSLVSIARHYRVARSVWTLVNKAPIPRLLSGEDVMRTLAIAQGPDVGQALTALEEEIDAGEVSTPDEAVVFIREWWAARADAEGADGSTGVPETS